VSLMFLYVLLKFYGIQRECVKKFCSKMSYNSVAPFHSLVLDCCIDFHVISELEIVTRILSFLQGIVWYLHRSYMCHFNLICFVFTHFYDGGLQFNINFDILNVISYTLCQNHLK